VHLLAPLFIQYFTDQVPAAFELLVANIHLVILGVLVGMFFGVLPGMGGSVTLAVMLPFTIGWEPFPAFAFFSGGVAATTFAGSLTAILVSIPGTGSNAATLIEGYPLTQQGEANRAIGASALSSASGAVLGVIVFILAVPFFMDFALLLGPPELFWLILWTLIFIPLMIGGNSILALVFASLGAIFALMGRSALTGEIRFDFGFLFLQDGLTLVPVLLGIFAFAELMRLVLSGKEKVADVPNRSGTSVITGFKDVFEHKYLWFRSALIGIFMGIVPGIGGSGATFLAYGHAVQSADNTEGFQSGRIEGVIASESANDAKDGGALFPTLGLGIPGSGSMAVFLAAMLFHGIVPGPSLLQTELDLILMIAMSILVGNILTSVIGVLFANIFTKIIEVPLSFLVPSLTALMLGAGYTVRNEIFDVIIAVLFGIFGLIMIYLNISRIPFIIAFILVGILESNYVTAVALAGGDPVTGLLGDFITLIVIGILFIPLIVWLITKQLNTQVSIPRSRNT
jgi:putative tricarboxylic transport membrane protein